ncbi:MAG: dienelactone hydrolase family protein [Nitrospiraceae bacterium]
MSDHTPPFSSQQIGTSSFRFSSGVPIPTMMDASTDPYFRTRVPKEAQVEGIQFWPQEKGAYPGIVLLHEEWGLTSQIKDLAQRLACEGYAVMVPNLYGRQGGMVTADTEVAEALAARAKEDDLLQDVNSCCEFFNSRDMIKRNAHGVIGFGMGGSLAIRFACQRKRLRAAVAVYGKVTTPAAVLKTLCCPVLYHRAGSDPCVSDEQMASLVDAGKESGKPIDIQTYEHAPHGFCNYTRREQYRPDAAHAAWESTVSFLRRCFQSDAR